MLDILVETARSGIGRGVNSLFRGVRRSAAQVDEMVRRIAWAEAEIIKAVTRGGPALYAIGADVIRRTWL